MGKEGAEGLFLGLSIGGFARTFAVYEDLCAISVRPHQYCLIVYLFLCQARLRVDNFQELDSC
jgi:hypothetical protein